MIGRSKPIFGDKNPPIGHYKPKFEIVSPVSPAARLLGKDIDFNPNLFNRKPEMPDAFICTKLVRNIKHPGTQKAKVEVY